MHLLALSWLDPYYTFWAYLGGTPLTATREIPHYAGGGWGKLARRGGRSARSGRC